MKKILLLCGMLFLLLATGPANATLITIGTATYGGSDYNLIWDDDNNGNSVIWLDYTHSKANWANQVDWASGLDASLTYNIDSAYSVTWDDAAWRLPTTVDGTYQYGYDGTTTAGYNITTSEMGHLYYEELGNLGVFNTSGNVQSGYGLTNTGDFDNLVASWYWSGTEYANNPVHAWNFFMDGGSQFTNFKNGDDYGLAVRSGQVSAVDPIPEPCTMLLLSMGLVSLAGYGRKKRISG